MTVSRRSVLVVAYYFPPMGLSGVQRTSKFVKYLPDHGWDPVVLTPEPRGYFAFDPELLAEIEERGIQVVRTRSLDPTRAFSGRVALPEESKRRRLASLSQWAFIPDNKIGWFPFGLRAGSKLLADHNFSAIFSTAPPYSSHLMAARLSRKFRLPLVVDFRDDWLENPRHVYPTGIHRAIHARQEARVADAADATITINNHIAERLRRRLGGMVEVIPQGFDPEDYGEKAPRDKRLRFVYTGVFYDRQTPVPFLEGLAGILRDQPGLRAQVKARFVGTFPRAGWDAVERFGLQDVAQVLPYTSHREAMAEVQNSDVPWLTVGAGMGQEQISTGKLYAYMGAGKPILGLVPEGAARDALDWYDSSWCAHPDRPEDVDRVLREITRLWSEDALPVPPVGKTAKHDRRVLTGTLAEVLDRVAS